LDTMKPKCIRFKLFWRHEESCGLQGLGVVLEHTGAL
jgi:hypothetical protein